MCAPEAKRVKRRAELRANLSAKIKWQNFVQEFTLGDVSNHICLVCAAIINKQPCGENRD